jgi:hypothetical protein
MDGRRDEAREVMIDGIMTFLSVRRGIAVIAFILPLLLPLWGECLGIEWQGSLSAYYHATPGTIPMIERPATRCQKAAGSDVCENKSTYALGRGRLRDVFAGLLFAVGVLLLCRNGFNGVEHFFFSLGGLFAICTALVPMGWPPDAHGDQLQYVYPSLGILGHGHLVYAVAFLASIGFVAAVHPDATVKALSDRQQSRYRRRYRVAGILMIVCPLIAAAVGLPDRPPPSPHAIGIWLLEIASAWAFGVYWWTKDTEVRVIVDEYWKRHREHGAASGTPDARLEEHLLLRRGDVDKAAVVDEGGDGVPQDQMHVSQG